MGSLDRSGKSLTVSNNGIGSLQFWSHSKQWWFDGDLPQLFYVWDPPSAVGVEIVTV